MSIRKFKRNSTAKNAEFKTIMNERDHVHAAILEICLNASLESIALLEAELISKPDVSLSKKMEVFKEVLTPISESFINRMDDKNDNYIFEGTDELFENRGGVEDADFILVMNTIAGRMFTLLTPVYLSIRMQMYSKSADLMKYSKSGKRKYVLRMNKQYEASLLVVKASIKSVSLPNKSIHIEKVNDFIHHLVSCIKFQ